MGSLQDSLLNSLKWLVKKRCVDVLLQIRDILFSINGFFKDLQGTRAAHTPKPSSILI